MLPGDGLADDPFLRLAQTSSSQDKALADAVAKQPWDPSIQVLAGLPKGVKRLADDIQWTTDLGNAFLAQQSDVMDAVRRMRKKAQDKGNLKSTEQQVVEIKVAENKSCVTVVAAAWTNGKAQGVSPVQ